MIFEIARIEVAAGHEAAFEAAVEEATELFRSAPGCRSMRLERGIEAPGSYRLVVGWERIEDHLEVFRNSPAFQRWRELGGPHFASAPTVEHVTVAVAGF